MKFVPNNFLAYILLICDYHLECRKFCPGSLVIFIADICLCVCVDSEKAFGSAVLDFRTSVLKKYPGRAILEISVIFCHFKHLSRLCQDIKKIPGIARVLKTSYKKNMTYELKNKSLRA